jgi:protein gp37
MSWNPVSGCTPISMGCTNCYDITRAQKLQYCGVKNYEYGFKLTVHPNLLNPDFNKYPPRRIFAGSMTDLFHDDISLEIKRQVFRAIYG